MFPQQFLLHTDTDPQSAMPADGTRGALRPRTQRPNSAGRNGTIGSAAHRAAPRAAWLGMASPWSCGEVSRQGSSGSGQQARRGRVACGSVHTAVPASAPRSAGLAARPRAPRGNDRLGNWSGRRAGRAAGEERVGPYYGQSATGLGRAAGAATALSPGRRGPVFGCRQDSGDGVYTG